MTSPFDLVSARLHGVKRAGEGLIARCPSHDDHRQSLSVSEGEDGRVLLHCHAGCTVESICAALHIEPGDLFAKNGDRQREIVGAYDYVDEIGALLYQVVRFEPKDFRQRKPDGAGGWLWKLGDTRRVLYRLPQVLAAAAAGKTVYVCEGEKDVHAIEQAGAVATCNAGGAGKWRAEYSQALRGARVVIVADKDAPGYAHAAAVAASAGTQAASVRVVEAKEGKDAADHLAAGFGLEDFVAVVPAVADSTIPAAVHYIDWTTFWDGDDEEQEWVWRNVLAKGRGHAIYATHKAGKSLLSLHMAAEMATSGGHTCLYLDYEMTAPDIRERLRDMGYGPDSDLSHLYYALLPTLPPLDSEEGGIALAGIVDEIAAQNPGRHIVTVIDTISRAVWGEENSADTWRLFYVHTGLRLKQRGITWLRLDHGGKDAAKGQRGSSGKGDDVDVVWKLVPTLNGVCLHRELARMNWIPEMVSLLKRDYPLAYLPAVVDWPEGTAALANLMDRLELPLTVSRRTACARLREANEGRRDVLVLAALRFRKERAEEENTTHLKTPAGGVNTMGTAETSEAREPLGNDVGNQSIFSLGTTAGTTGNQMSGVSGNQWGSHKRAPRNHAVPESDGDIPW